MRSPSTQFAAIGLPSASRNDATSIWHLIHRDCILSPLSSGKSQSRSLPCARRHAGVTRRASEFFRRMLQDDLLEVRMGAKRLGRILETLLVDAHMTALA